LHDPGPSANYRVGIVGQVNYNLDQTSIQAPAPWKWCRKCEGLAYSGISSGVCSAGGAHDFSQSAEYGLVTATDNLSVMYTGHETGHCLGLQHSWSANPDVEYGDGWDTMGGWATPSYVPTSFTSPYNGQPAGPGLNAPTLYKLGWIPESRVFNFVVPPPFVRQLSNVQLVALNRPDISGYLMARVLSPDHTYTVEFRQATRWDSGIGDEGMVRDGVLIHELRSNYTTGQNGWCYCDKCAGLWYAGRARCPAGGAHDHSQSLNYNLALNDPIFGGQHGWHVGEIAEMA
jgi:Gametolysin peptidase M11